VRDEELRGALADHLEQTRFHVARVQEAFHAAGGEPAAARSAALAGLLQQHDEQQVKEPGLRDLFHAWGAIRTEHLELAAYDTLLGLLPDDGLRANRDEEADSLARVAGIADRLRAELRT
jgi:ferritin-like metal-binding protein YciE